MALDFPTGALGARAVAVCEPCTSVCMQRKADIAIDTYVPMDSSFSRPNLTPAGKQ